MTDKSYYGRSRDRIREQQRQYYAKNKERITAQRRQYYANNAARICKRVAEYRANNPIKVYMWGLRRRMAFKQVRLAAENKELEAAAQAAGGYNVEKITKANAATAKGLELFLAVLESK